MCDRQGIFAQNVPILNSYPFTQKLLNEQLRARTRPNALHFNTEHTDLDVSVITHFPRQSTDVNPQRQDVVWVRMNVNSQGKLYIWVLGKMNSSAVNCINNRVDVCECHV